MRFADVRDDICVGDYRACDDYLPEFPLSIHVWRDDNWREGRFCKRLHASSRTGGGPGLAVHWREGARLRETSVPADEIADYARRPGGLLVHCAGGICRSLSLAVVCKVARGCDVFRAIAEIYEGTWPAYRNPPDFRPKTMEDIINWALGLPPGKEFIP